MSSEASNLQIVVGNYRYSSWSLRGWLAVKHSGIPHETLRLPLFTEEGMAQLKELSPSGLVPCLIDHMHGGEHGPIKVWDSLAIIDYLAKVAPEHYWWPEDPAAHAFARAISAEMHSGFPTLRAACPMNLGKTHRGLAMTPALTKDVERVGALWKEARTRFGLSSPNPGPFLFGAWSAADMMFAPVVTRFITYGLPAGSVARAYMAAVDTYTAMDHWRMAAQHESEVIEKYDRLPADGVLGSNV